MPSTRELDPALQPWADYLLDVARYNGLRVQLTSARRTRGQQETLYRRYLSCQTTRGRGGCLPAAPPGSSDHEIGLAFDLVVNGDYRSPEQEALGRFWESLGGRWAGSSDPVHFAV